MQWFRKFNDVRTKSFNTAAVLLLLGHTPLDVLDVESSEPVIRFAKTAEVDLRRYLAAKNEVEVLLDRARQAKR